MSAKKSGSESSKITNSVSGVEGETRLRELVLYISDKCFDDPTFGLGKLNKILYFADFESYIQFGQPITGVEYIRLAQGPVPRPMKALLHNLEDQREIIIRQQRFYEQQQNRVIPARQANLDLFKPQHIALVDELIRKLWGETAASIGLLSYEMAWKIVKEGELIPYEAALLSDKALTQADINRAQELIDQYGWDV